MVPGEHASFFDYVVMRSLLSDIYLFKQVSKYYPRGNLVNYLKALSGTVARVDALKMTHEISNGMAYLHKQGVLHGDLKVQIPAIKADPLVIADTRTGCKYTCR